jgi:hypothetical protein
MPGAAITSLKIGLGAVYKHFEKNCRYLLNQSTATIPAKTDS